MVYITLTLSFALAAIPLFLHAPVQVESSAPVSEAEPPCKYELEPVQVCIFVMLGYLREAVRFTRAGDIRIAEDLYNMYMDSRLSPKCIEAANDYVKCCSVISDCKYGMTRSKKAEGEIRELTVEYARVITSQ